KRLDKLDKAFPKKEKGSLNAALIAIRPKTGEIVAMVGGRDFLQNQFNRATDAERQPGSVFKPFVYATAINSAYDTGSRVFTTSTIFKDEKKTFNVGSETYSPNNYGDVFSNKEMTLRDALVKSKNNITVDLGIQLNIGKVMNLAARAGMPKVEKAYPSMALGTAEATPLQVATAYTTFANLGEKTSPIAISRVTNGNGQTVIAPVTEKKKVLQPDVAYILDDMMKDVINRGTAVAAQNLGFKNVAGKFGFAGKTGTSRDGWFAGFTPDLVCVVYVGFDNGDDLGMTGADSALPIWGDFMREALTRHPDWNGDWQMPGSVQKAEIDIRDGSLISDLDKNQADVVQAQVKNLKNDTNSNPANTLSDSAAQNPLIASAAVPPEFRRAELFINGTTPVKLVPETNTAQLDAPTPLPTATPFSTWQNEQSGEGIKVEPETDDEIPPAPPVKREVTVMICPLTGMRATSNCPVKEARTFKAGEEPKEFCNIHTRPPNVKEKNILLNPE
ncbi:MAG: penicillin-binding transpeptidase domain-containing protein, partial [Pyrinomonadaceae bacterium]